MDILALSASWKVVAVIWMILTVFLILLVLVQKGRGAGLGGAFGGGAGGGLLGTKTGDFLTWVTIVVASVFLLLAIVLGIWAATETRGSLEQPTATPAQPVVPADAEIPEPNELETQTPAQAVDQTAEAIEDTVEEAVEQVEEVIEDVDVNAVQ